LVIVQNKKTANLLKRSASICSQERPYTMTLSKGGRRTIELYPTRSDVLTGCSAVQFGR